MIYICQARQIYSPSCTTQLLVPGGSRANCIIQFMLPDGSRTICMIQHMFPGFGFCAIQIPHNISERQAEA